MAAAAEQTFIDPTTNIRHAFPSLDEVPTLDLSVVIPAYNEQMRLPPTLDETLGYLTERSERQDFNWEVVVVDDGSRDDTVNVAQKYVARYGADKVRVLRMVRNMGKGGAVRSGVLVTRGRYVLMADADGATVFEDLEKLEAAAAQGVDVAVGSRVHLRGKKEGRGLIRSLLSFVFNLVVVWIGGVVGVGDTQCGFKLYSREAARIAFEGQRLTRWGFDVENLYRVQKKGLKVGEVSVRWTEVPGSKLNIVKATLNMVKDMLRMRWKYSRGEWQL